MSLSPVERLTLANQYRIMAKLYSESESTYSRWADELERGYESFYNDIFQDIEDPLPEEESKFVLDVLGMYQVLQNSATNLSQVDQQALEGVRHLLVMTVHPIYRREVMASASRLLAGRYGPLVLVWGGRST